MSGLGRSWESVPSLKFILSWADSQTYIPATCGKGSTRTLHSFVRRTTHKYDNIIIILIIRITYFLSLLRLCTWCTSPSSGELSSACWSLPSPSLPPSPALPVTLRFMPTQRNHSKSQHLSSQNYCWLYGWHGMLNWWKQSYTEVKYIVECCRWQIHCLRKKMVKKLAIVC